MQTNAELKCLTPFFSLWMVLDQCLREVTHRMGKKKEKKKEHVS